MQRCSNPKGRFVSVQSIHHGGRRGSIIILEIRDGGGWKRFGVEICVFAPELNVSTKPKQNQVPYMDQKHSVVNNDGKLTSFAAIASGSGTAQGECHQKGKEKIEEQLQKAKEQLQHYSISNGLTINMGSVDCVRNGKSGVITLSSDIQI